MVCVFIHGEGGHLALDLIQNQLSLCVVSIFDRALQHAGGVVLGTDVQNVTFAVLQQALDGFQAVFFLLLGEGHAPQLVGFFYNGGMGLGGTTLLSQSLSVFTSQSFRLLLKLLSFVASLALASLVAAFRRRFSFYDSIERAGRKEWMNTKANISKGYERRQI